MIVVTPGSEHAHSCSFDGSGEREVMFFFKDRTRFCEFIEVAMALVKVMADFYKINLVLRYNSDTMDLEKPDTVIRGVMKNIVYHDEDLDMTKAIMQYLTKQMERQAAAPVSGVQR